MLKKIAVFPGSFDPITIGHESIVKRSLKVFDEVIIAISTNIDKHCFFPLEKRIEWLEKVFQSYPQIKVMRNAGLTIDFCKQHGAEFILRGLRTSADFEFERKIGQVNKQMYGKIETVFLLSEPQHTSISSSVVREVITYGGDASQFVPEGVELKF